MEQSRSQGSPPPHRPSRSGAVADDPSPDGAAEERSTATVPDVSVSGTHPAIAEPPPCVADRHWAVDRVLFAIAAVMALGFVV
ncbi:BCCT family transporter, partial [Geodermatophilus sp. SYSU D01176]